MAGRVQGKGAIVVGGGQTPGATIGNGRATAIVLAREGARVIVVDRRKDSAQETVDMIKGEGSQGWALEADATSEESVRQMIVSALAQRGAVPKIGVIRTPPQGDAPLRRRPGFVIHIRPDRFGGIGPWANASRLFSGWS